MRARFSSPPSPEARPRWRDRDRQRRLPGRRHDRPQAGRPVARACPRAGQCIGSQTWLSAVQSRRTATRPNLGRRSVRMRQQRKPPLDGSPWGFARRAYGAAERIRTSTGSRPHGPEPCVYTSFTTAAGELQLSNCAASQRTRMGRRRSVRRAAEDHVPRRRVDEGKARSFRNRLASGVCGRRTNTTALTFPRWRDRAVSPSERAGLAAIVQGTRTPPSHGGNPGSNPGSGTKYCPANKHICGSGKALWGRIWGQAARTDVAYRPPVRPAGSADWRVGSALLNVVLARSAHRTGGGVAHRRRGLCRRRSDQRT